MPVIPAAPLFNAPAAPRAAAPFLPMSREEMRLLGWDQCDIIIISGDA